MANEIMRAFDLAASRPWVIQPEALEELLAIANRTAGDPEALEAKLGRPLDNARSVQVRDGVAVIPITGPIFRYANMFTRISGATSTSELARDFTTALENPGVRAILFNIDSPGGEASGINELAAMIWAGREKKPVSAYTGSKAASAGYWLAAACGSITMDATAMVGSIGVVMSYSDTRKRDEKSDVRSVDIVSSVSPHKRSDPNTDEGRASVQKIVDDLAAVFVEQVATYRGTDAAKVVADFGQGGMLVGREAVAAGMADALGSLESCISNLVLKVQRGSFMKGPITVANNEQFRQALAAGHTAEEITIAAVQPAVDVKAVQDAATASAVTAERGRIAALQALSTPGYEAVVQASITGGHTEEQCALALMKEQKARGGLSVGALTREAQGVTQAPVSAAVPVAAAVAKTGWDKAVAKQNARNSTTMADYRRKQQMG